MSSNSNLFKEGIMAGFVAGKRHGNGLGKIVFDKLESTTAFLTPGNTRAVLCEDIGTVSQAWGCVGNCICTITGSQDTKLTWWLILESPNGSRIGEFGFQDISPRIRVEMAWRFGSNTLSSATVEHARLVVEVVSELAEGESLHILDGSGVQTFKII